MSLLLDKSPSACSTAPGGQSCFHEDPGGGGGGGNQSMESCTNGWFEGQLSVHTLLASGEQRPLPSLISQHRSERQRGILGIFCVLATHCKMVTTPPRLPPLSPAGLSVCVCVCVRQTDREPETDKPCRELAE